MPSFLSRSVRALFFISACSFGAHTASAVIESTGTLDSPFNPGSVTNGQVNTVIIQPDGKFLVSGGFTKANGVTRRCIARFLPDGSLDPLFDPGTGLDAAPSGMILQPDNKILVYGGFSTVNGVARYASIARLNSNGSLDVAFDPGSKISSDGVDDGAGNAANPGFVFSAVLQAGGKVVVFGQFYYINTGVGTNVARSGVARFNSDGTFDASLNPGTGFTVTGMPDSAFPQFAVRQNVAPNDGKMIVSGYFDQFNGTSVPGLVRLNADGSYDAGFNPGTATSYGNLAGLFVQADDQVLVFGGFSSFNGVACNSIVRLTTAGAVDPGFNSALLKDYGDPGTIAAVAQQADGKLIVGGYFHTLGGVAANNVARLMSDGTRDGSFDSSVGAGALGFNVSAVAVRGSDQKILLGGWFPTYGNVNRNNIALANTDGSNDSNFAPSSGATDGGPEVFAVLTQADGRIIVGGVFTVFNGVPTHNIVRLNPDGTRDATFGITLGTSRSVRAMAVQPDGKIIIAGTFTAIDGVARGRVARLMPDGTVDPTFDTGTGPDNIVYAVALDAAGNVYIGGGFLNVNGTPRAGVAKLTPTGALDTTFNPGTGIFGNVLAVAPPTASAGVLIGGTFSTYNGSTAPRLARLDATTGALDTAFTTAGGTGFNSVVRALSLQADGKYLVGGSFTRYGTTTRNRMARLNADGTLDTTFVGPALGGGVVRALAQQNGKILVGGSFTTPAKQIVRVSSTGVLDSSFTTGTGAISSPADAFVFNNSSVDAFALQVDGKILAGGIFNSYNGIARTSFVRLTDNTLRIGAILRLPNLHITLSIFGAPNTSYQVQASSSPIPNTFVTIATVTTDGGGYVLYDDDASQFPMRFYRVIGNAATQGLNATRPPLRR